MDDQIQKAYIVPLTYGGWEKRVWFMGQDSEETEQRFKLACRELDSVGDGCTSWEDFLQRAVAHFIQSGFVRIEK